MGKFGLSVDFNNLSGEEHPIMNIYHIAHRRMGPLAAAPWVKHLLMGIPFIERMKYYRIFFNWTRQELNKNIEVRISFPVSQPLQNSRSSRSLTNPTNVISNPGPTILLMLTWNRQTTEENVQMLSDTSSKMQ